MMIRGRSAIAFFLAVLGLAGSLAAQIAPSSAQRAMLVRGGDPVKGLPYFPPNAIPALAGAYRSVGAVSAAGAVASPGADSGPEISVWFTKEPLILSSSWKRTQFGGFDAYLLARPQGAVLLLRESAYWLMFELPADDAQDRSFVRAFDRKFLAFYQNAASEPELSFPAFVDY